MADTHPLPPRSRPAGSGRCRRGLRRALLALCLAGAGAGTAGPVTLALTQFVEQPSLDACRRGIADALAAAGYRDGDNLHWIYENAHGSLVVADRVAKTFAGLEPTVAVAISTPSAQSLAAATASTPLVFAAVGDPVGAGLVADLERPGGRITGVSDGQPLARHLALVREILPTAHRLGVIFDPANPGSVDRVRRLREQAPAYGLSVTEAVADHPEALLAAAQSLVGRVDLIYLPTDVTPMPALDELLTAAERANLAVVAADAEAVRRGAVAALGVDYYELGRQAGRLVVRVLGGTAPGAIAVQTVEAFDLVVNPAAAARMGLQLPTGVLRRAREVVR